MRPDRYLVMKDLKDLVSHLVVLKASQVALTAIPSKYPDGYRCTLPNYFEQDEHSMLEEH
jgi:hypothetical protein